MTVDELIKEIEKFKLSRSYASFVRAKWTPCRRDIVISFKQWRGIKDRFQKQKVVKE